MILGRQIFIGYRQGGKAGYTKLMLQLIKKMFSPKTLRHTQGKKASGNGKKGKDNWAKKSDFAKGSDWAMQFRKMGKLRGKLILM